MDWVMVWHASRFESFVPKWPNQSCVHLLIFSSIYYWFAWMASNVCKSDTSGSQLKVPFAVTRHIQMCLRAIRGDLPPKCVALPFWQKLQKFFNMSGPLFVCFFFFFNFKLGPLFLKYEAPIPLYFPTPKVCLRGSRLGPRIPHQN